MIAQITINNTTALWALCGIITAMGSIVSYFLIKTLNRIELNQEKNVTAIQNHSGRLIRIETKLEIEDES